MPRRPAHALDVSEVVEQVDADARLARRGERELRAEPSRRELAAGEEAAVGEADAVVRAKGVGQQGRRDGAVGQQLRRGRVDWSKVGGGWGEICGQRDEKNDDDGWSRRRRAGSFRGSTRATHGNQGDRSPSLGTCRHDAAAAGPCIFHPRVLALLRGAVTSIFSVLVFGFCEDGPKTQVKGCSTWRPRCNITSAVTPRATA